MAGFGQYHPLGRVGRAEDIAELAGFMVSDQASWMTGAVVDLDGGYAQQGVAFPSAD
nr:SDR family oxidoreductase [Desulfobulbaceae bacterium]